MKSFIEIIGLTKDLDLVLKMKKSEFLHLLQTKTKSDRLIFLDLFDSEQKKFYGRIEENSFWLRKADRIAMKSPFAKATGVIKSESDMTLLAIKIKGWNWFILLWLGVISLMLGLILRATIENNTSGLFIILGPIFLMFYLFAFFKMRQGVRRFKDYLRKELNG